MSSPANKYPEQRVPEQPEEPIAGVVGGVHARAQQRWQAQADRIATGRHETQRHRMLQAFYGFAAQERQLDPKRPKRVDEPGLAHAIHAFAHAAVMRRKADHGIEIDILDEKRASRYIDQHYAEFRLVRDAVTGRKKPEELEAIITMRRKVYAIEYLEPEEGNDESGLVGTRRAQRYPEIGIALELREALLEDGSKLASEASEVVLAAYGSLFPPVTSYQTIEVQDETGAITRKIAPEWTRTAGNMMIQHISHDSIPPGQQAESWRPR